MQFIKSTTVHDLILFICLVLIIFGTCTSVVELWNYQSAQRPPYYRNTDDLSEPVKVPSFDERQADALENIGAELKAIRLLLENKKIPAN